MASSAGLTRLSVPGREASRKASLLVDTTIVDERREPLKLPAFEAAVMHAATRALERWRDEALEGAAAHARVHMLPCCLAAQRAMRAQSGSELLK